MAHLLSSCWGVLISCLLVLMIFISQHVFRHKKESSVKSMAEQVEDQVPEDKENEEKDHLSGLNIKKSVKDLDVHRDRTPEPKENEERDYFSGFKVDEEEEEEPSNFSFKFEYQIPKIMTENYQEPSLSTVKDTAYQEKTTNISNNYRFFSEKNFSGFVEEPKPMTFTIHESIINHAEEKPDSEFLLIEDSEKSSIQQLQGTVCSKGQDLKERKLIEPFIDRAEEKPESKFLLIEDSEKSSVNQSQDTVSSKGQDLEGRKLIEYETSRPFMSEKQITIGSFSGFDSDSESISLSDSHSMRNLTIDSDCDDSLSEKELEEEMSKLEDDDCSCSSEGLLFRKHHYLNEREIRDMLMSMDKMEDYLSSSSSEEDLNEQETKDNELPSSNNLLIEFVDSSDDEFLGETKLTDKKLDSEPREDDVKEQEETPMNDLNLQFTDRMRQLEEEHTENSEEPQMIDLDEEEEDELESLWEHQDLVEQLRMEIKKAKAVGLPTIFEESESEKVVDDLKPWKIEAEKFSKEHPMDELHKFYKSYGERMRKFDILNYQKMYALGFLQLKNPLESAGIQKPLMQAVFAHLPQYLKPFYRRKSKKDPSEKFIRDLQIEFETVYVGQMCLSWEFLRWQYEKARELPDSDPYRSHQYNHVAGEFQQFQVILQRFIENESFQGPRLQNYVKSRCVIQNLLQVPIIKEDCLKDKMEGKKKGEYAITSEMLEDIMEECIGLFWDFVKADKLETSAILKGLFGHQVELQEPTDFRLMVKIQRTLQKKEKKLKDIMKTGNCLVKKFKKPREDRSNQDLFFSLIDVRLVSRVLKMSRLTTDQLMWCHKKLSKISISDWKIRRKPSFLLFPC